MLDDTKNPHFIPDKPAGVDCFEGHSQERLAHSVCDYIRMVDTKPKDKSKREDTMPRIVGLEGSWGSGKSNVVRMINKELEAEGYHSFIYDAWGHQEDLQRRSILETLTGSLIREKILQGEVEIQMRNGKPHKDMWENQLSLLLSNKTTTIKHSMPRLSGAAVWGICLVAAFAVLTVISGLILDNVSCFPVWAAIIMDLLPILLGLCVASYYRHRDGNWDRTLKLISQREDDTIDEEYTSSEEPSVAEFKNWMKAISDHLSTCKGRCKKLIIVFDNMDRLPSEKVMQLWSSIYTFFAGGEFENIWTVIPYDYKHLCQAIYGSDDKNDGKVEDVERIKQFISKTFPITYHVPGPVITDYGKLFYTYFDMAFGPEEHDREHICQVFTHLEEHPNPRTVIRFVNELVAMRLQWKDEKYRLQNLALYILKKDFLFYSRENLDTQLLSEHLFDKIGAFYPDKEKVRTELCQYAYGLENEKLAGELPLRNELKRMVTTGQSIVNYVDKPNFLTVLKEVINDTDQASLNNVVKSMASLDGVEQSTDIKEQLEIKWDFLANMKAERRYEGHQYDNTLTILIQHATQKRVVAMAKKYAEAMQKLPVNDGAAYFKAQLQLQEALKAANVTFDDSRWYKPVTSEADVFAKYVFDAKEEYKHYGLRTGQRELNDYLYKGAISGNSIVATVVDYIKDDEYYDLADLKKALLKAISEDIIKQDICVAAYVHRVLSDDEGVLKERFKPDTVTDFLNGDKAPWAEKLPVGLEDVIAMSLADGKDLIAIDDKMLPRVCECMGSYFDYTHLLKHTGKDGSAFRKMNVYCIENLKGKRLNTLYVARHLVELQNALGVEQVQLVKQFNQWPVIKWGQIKPDNEYVKEVKNYVHQSFFEAYYNNPGNFSDSVIKLGVGAMECQNIGYLAKAQQVQQNYRMVLNLVVDDYWKDFVEIYLGTEYMPQAGALLTNEAVTMLQWLYDHNAVTEPELLNFVLAHADEANLKSYLHNIMNDHIVKSDINKLKFLWFGKLLPLLGSDMDQNTARGLLTHFLKPIFTDPECGSVIVEHQEFYLGLMKKDCAIAAPIIKEMSGVETYAPIAIELNALVKEEKK